MEKVSTLYMGMDIGDRYCYLCIVDEIGDEVEVIEASKIRTTPDAVRRYFTSREPLVVAMEVGTHSPWISRLVNELGHEVIVANARKLQFIYQNDQKHDEVDAELLARVARADRKLLSPIEHRGRDDSEAMALLRSRDRLVRTRTDLVNHVRGMVKSYGARLPKTAAARFHKLKCHIPEALRALDLVMEVLSTVTKQINDLDRTIERISQERYPETQVLRQVPGVGPLTALTFVLVIADAHRFSRNRKVGAYIGLTPRLDKSGNSNPQLSISKGGNPYLRRLLVGAAHYIIGRFGPDSELKRHGLRIAERGGKRAKKRAAVAVARKLSVLLLALLKSGAKYEPFYSSEALKKVA